MYLLLFSNATHYHSRMDSRVAPSRVAVVPTRREREGDPPGGRGPRQLKSESLFAGQRELLIEHSGSLYRLRVTQQNKLILTK